MKRFGIDISAYQEPGTIKYDVLAKNIDFAILRAGYSGWGDQSPHKDDYFEKHYQELHRRGVPLGAYYFSTADTVDLARKEADAFLNYINGKEFSYPIVLDVEDEHNQAKLSPDSLTDVCIAFLEKLENAGYFASLYASEYWLTSKLSMNKLNPYDLWVAKWSNTEPSIRHGMWQYTSDGFVQGYVSRLDCNYAYQDYPAIIKGAGLNGFKKQASKPKQEAKPKKTVEQLATEVIQGKWGNGQDRKNRLTKAGYSYDDVQNEVNKKLGQSQAKRTYKVKPGESWWSIAETVYGNGQKMYELAKKNGKTISTVIHPGDVLYY